jgi:hypothetical protein
MFPEIQLITETKAQVVKVPQESRLSSASAKTFLYVAKEHYLE